MHLYILIPHYNETEEVYSPLLNNLNNQIEIDPKDITIVISKSSVQYPFPDITKYENIKERCVLIGGYAEIESSATARAIGLHYIENDFHNYSKSYITMIDVDDNLTSNSSLKMIFDSIQEFPDKDFYWFTPKLSREDTKSESTADKCAVWSAVFNVDFIQKYQIHFSNTHIMEDIFFRISCDAIPNIKKISIDKIFYYHLFDRPGATTSHWLSKTYWESALESIRFYNDWYNWDPGVEKNNNAFYEWAFIDFRGFFRLNIDDYPEELGEILFRILGEYESDVKSGKVIPSSNTVENYQFIINTLTNYFHQ